MWRVIVGWPVVSIIVVLLISAGIGVMSMTPAQYGTAKACFIVGILLFTLRLTAWLIGPDSNIGERLILAFVLFGGVGAVLVGLLFWVDRSRAQFLSTKPAIEINGANKSAESDPPSMPASVPVPKLGTSAGIVSPPIHRPFARIYNMYKEKLGVATEEASTDDLIYQGTHENARVIFFHHLWGWYVLFRQIGTWEFRDDNAMDSDPRWVDSNWLRKQDWMGNKSQPPKGKLYPDGGLAKLWYADKAWWSHIGWKEWECAYFNQDIYYQRFERGIIMGVFRSNPKYDDAQIFILTDGGKYFVETDASLMPPACGSGKY